ncbi:MAG: PEP-CTERM sorting domain-containing protein, partial [Chthoniobacterales bacterium]
GNPAYAYDISIYSSVDNYTAIIATENSVTGYDGWKSVTSTMIIEGGQTINFRFAVYNARAGSGGQIRLDDLGLEFGVTMIPEPGSLTLTLLAGGIFAGLRKYRRRFVG